MTPIQRRILYVGVFELLAVAAGTTMLSLIGYRSGSSFAVAVASSLVAVTWNFIWNTLFERWERAQLDTRRTLKRRVVHTVGFEGGLVVILVPVMALLLGVSLAEAFALEAGLLLFFLVYTFIYSLAFDAIFGPAVPVRAALDAPDLPDAPPASLAARRQESPAAAQPGATASAQPTQTRLTTVGVSAESR